MISSALLLSLVSATALVSINPPRLDLDDAKVAKFQIKLARKPTAPVQVYLEGRGVEFSTCVLEIDENSYDKPIDVVLNGVPVFDQRDPTTIPVKIRVYEGDKETNQDYQIVRKPLPGGTCTSVGDPHYKTFDGKALDFQGNGCYQFFSSEDLEVQTTATTCFNAANGPTCNQAVAIRYGSTVMALDVRQGADMREISPNKDGLSYVPPKKGDVTHTVTLPCGSKINMIVNSQGNYKWIDLTLNAAGGYTSTGGMCNKLGNTDGKLHGRTTAYNNDQHPQFFQSWKVPDQENLLLGKYRETRPQKAVPVSKCVLPNGPKPRPSPSPSVVLPPYVPVITTSVAPKPSTTAVPVETSVAPVLSTAAIQTTAAAVPTSSPAAALSSSAPIAGSSSAPVQSSAAPIPSSAAPAQSSAAASSPAPVQTTSANFATTTVALQTTQRPVPTQAPPPPPEYKAQVETYCKNLFKEACAAIVDREFYVQACIKDALLLGSLVHAEATKIQYMSQCKTKSDYLKEDMNVKQSEKAAEIQVNAGLGENKCLKNCSGNGICGDNGCRCKPAFGGQDCSVDLTKMISYDQEKRVYTPTTPATAYPEVGALPASEKELDDLKRKPATQIVSSAMGASLSFGLLVLSLL